MHVCVCVYSSIVAEVTCRGHGGWGSGCSDYLRISCREALISLPRSHSTGLGLSHLQCKAERMGRGWEGGGGRGRGEQGGGGGSGRVESTALTLTLSLSHHPPFTCTQIQTDTKADLHSTHRLWVMATQETGEKIQSEAVSRVITSLIPTDAQHWSWEAEGKGCWREKPPTMLV